MNIKQERRKEKRLNCDWPIWFAESFGKTLYYGEILNISSQALALTCKTDKNLPHIASRITAYFKVPHMGGYDSSDVITLSCKGCVFRVDTVEDNKSLRKIVIEFEKSLPFKPGKINGVNQFFDALRRKKNTSNSRPELVEATNRRHSYCLASTP